MSASGSGTVTLTPIPTVTVNSPTVCSGATATLTATPGAAATYSYAWTVPATATNPGNVASFTTTIAGTYSVIITNTTTTCSSVSASGTVTLDPLPTVSVNSPSACSGASATVSATPGAAGTYSYAWTVPATATNPGNVASFSTTVAGTYSVIITNTTTSCVSSSGSGTVTINPNPTVSVNSPTVCSGTSATVTATPGAAGTYSYAWTVPATATNPGNVASFSTTTAGTYSVIITNTATTCVSASGSGTVTINQTPVVSVNSQSICSGGSATITATPSTVANYTYTWTVPASATNPGNVNSFSTSTAGTYSVTITNTITLCPSLSASGVLTVNPIPTVSVANASVCSGTPANLTAIPGNGGTYSYAWTVPATASNPGNVASFTTSTAGNYSVIITNTATTCVSTSVSATVTINATPQISVTSPQVCIGTSATVTATPAAGAASDYNYVWTIPAGAVNPGNVPLFGTLVAGTYSVVATSIANGCVSPSAAVNVIINPLPTATLNQNGYVCVDAMGTTLPGSNFVLDTNLDPTLYTFEWFTNNVSNGVTTSDYTAITPNVYKVKITSNATGCFGFASATVAASMPPTSLSYTVTDYFSNNQTITVSALPAGNYQYQIDNGPFQDSNIFENLNSGNHTIKVRDLKYCGELSLNAITIDYPHFFTPNGDGYNDTWNVTDLQILNDQPNSQVTIFDRFGKLIKQISIQGQGWDGTYNDVPLPSTDYWFTLDYVEKNIQKQFKAHFSLKR